MPENSGKMPEKWLVLPEKWPNLPVLAAFFRAVRGLNIG
jgi:hypothetical protein